MSVNHDARVFALEQSIVHCLCKAMDTPRSLAVDLLLRHGEYEQLVDLSIDPRHYSKSSAFADDYLVTSILSKNPRLPLQVNKRDVAIAKFRAAEVDCAKANTRIQSFYKDPHSVDFDVRSVLLSSQMNIEKILGPFPSRKDLDFAEQNMRFGPGATTSVTGIVTQGKKYSLRTLEATSRVLPYRTFCFPDLWKQNNHEIHIREYSKMAVVPKNAKTDRVICIEPDLNIYVQLGTGALIRSKLLRSGLDLNSQIRNQELAQRAHLDHLSTVDLSSASDTLCREAVWCLLPLRWAQLLHFSRVDNTSLDGEVIPLNKWSSMGNGYTFELESLIFFAVAKSVCEYLGLPTDDVTAYGDDIILPRAAQTLLVRTLNFLGFSVNHEKTFGEGVFHESCGADFFQGQNVRPVFLRSKHHDFESICYLYANSLSRWAGRFYNGRSRDSRLLPAWLRCFTAVEPNHRHLIPEGFGDTGFAESFDRATPSISYGSRRRGWAGFTFQYRGVKSKEAVIDIQGCYLAALNGGTTDFSRGLESLRGRFRPPSTEMGYVLTWPHLGPWE